jgi:nitrate reductase assembly molybdenum cofactor insertion protein NarJ
MTPESMNEQVALLREAAEWAMIGLLFECPIGDWRQRVSALAADVADPSLREAAEWAQRESDQGIYHTTFGPGGPAAIREVSYRDTVHPGPVLAELRGVYEAFAYAPVLQEPPDHVAVQAGFIGYLRLKEAYAGHCGLARQAAACAAVADRIMADHLALMAQPLAASLKMSGIRYAAAAAAALLQRVGSPRTQAVGQAQVLECVESGCTFSFDEDVSGSNEPAEP